MFKSLRLAAAGALIAGLLGAYPAPADEGVALRQRYFGYENVDSVTGAVRPDRVILSWFGVTNFAAAINGHVVLLDAWVPHGEYSGYVPSTPLELAKLRPEFIFAGHSHFDHTADAGTIIKAGVSPITVVGTPEQCAQIRSHAAPATAACIEAVPAGAPFGATGALNSLIPGVGISVIKHVHSAAEEPDPSDAGGPHAPAAPPPDANAVVHHLPAPQDTADLAAHLGDAENGTLLYQFRIGDFALVWHDSAGPLKEVAPGVLTQLEGLPAPTDVELGAIMGFNQLTNGLRDPRMYIERIRPKIFVPIHHDNWAPGVSTRGENYQPIVEAELQRIPAGRRPILRFISDPQDYVRPEVLTFDVNSPYWQ
ncbi:MAG: MBL fold metallo-hydrolase [Actinomycetota bacterium]